MTYLTGMAPVSVQRWPEAHGPQGREAHRDRRHGARSRWNRSQKNRSNREIRAISGRSLSAACSGSLCCWALIDLISKVVGPSGRCLGIRHDLASRYPPGGGLTSAASPSPASLSAASPIAVAPTASSHQGLFPSPAASPAPRSLAVTAIAAFGPEGMSDGDDPGFASSGPR